MFVFGLAGGWLSAAEELEGSLGAGAQGNIQAQAFARRAGLATPATGASRDDLVKTALASITDETEKAAVMAAAGVGTFSKIESPSGYPAVGVEKTYP